MIPVRSILDRFRRPLLREIALHLGLLAVALQIGFSAFHAAAMAARPADGVELAWCAPAGHAPVPGDERAADDVCPLCQLPPSGPVPPVMANAAVPVDWIVRAFIFAPETAAHPASRDVLPYRPRGPPAAA